MKKFALLLLFALTNIFAYSQKGGHSDNKDCECSANSPKQITADAENLIASYQKLFANSKENCLSSQNILTSFGVMTCPNYSSHGLGNITFASFHIGIDSFRSIWNSKESSYNYYWVCPPRIIDFPAEAISNDIYLVKFVRIKDYVTSTQRNTQLAGIKVDEIKSIDCIKLEGVNGYIATMETSLYNDKYSSKGIIAYLTLKDNSKIICYIVNNYDATGTLKWKE